MSGNHGKRRVRIAPGVLSREVHGESVLLHLDSGEYFGLDEVATRIWQLLTDGGDLQLVESTIRDEYGLDPDVAAKDVAALVSQLLEKRLVEVLGPESES